MRFVYSASCVCHILDDWSGINVDKAVQYIKNSQVSALFSYTYILYRIDDNLCMLAHLSGL